MPMKYTPEEKLQMYTEICKEIAEGKALTTVLKARKQPSYSSFMEWMWEDETGRLSEMYDRARETQADHMVDKLFETIAQEDDVQRARLLADTTKWVACKFRPGRYGDRATLQGSKDGAPIKVILSKEDEDL